MTATVAPITALLLGVALLLTGNGLQGTLLPVRASLEAFGTLEIGILGSSYFVGFAAGCFYGPHLVRRAGHIRTFTAMVAIASCVALAHVLIINPVFWWVMRASTGFCFAVLYMVIESWLNERATNENRGVVFSIYTIINLTVMTLGQMMLVIEEPSEFTLFAFASILVSLAAVPVALTRSPAPAPIAAVKIRLRYLYRLSPVGVVGCLTVGLANGSFWGLAPVFAQSGGQGSTAVALFMSFAVIAGAIGQWPLGHLSDRIDRRKVIILATFGAALAGIGMVLLPDTVPGGVFPFAFLFGLFAFPLYALSVAHMNDFVEPAGYVEAAGGLLLVFALGAAVGPLLASIVIGFVGIQYLFAYTAFVHLAMAGFAVHRLYQREPVSEEEQVPFVDSIRVAQTVSLVDPLSSPEELPVEPSDVSAPSGDHADKVPANAGPNKTDQERP